MVRDQRAVHGHSSYKKLPDGQSVVLGRNFWEPPTEMVVRPKPPKDERDDEEDSPPDSLDYPFDHVPIKWKPGARKNIAPALKDNHLKINYKKTDKGYEVTLEDLGSKNGSIGTFINSKRTAEIDQYKDHLLSCQGEGEKSLEGGKYFAMTEQGSRDDNQDGALILPNSIVLVDGHQTYGQLAARVTLKTFHDILSKDDANLGSGFYSSDKILRRMKIHGGTTAAVAHVKTSSDGQRLLEVGHVGDSRIYVISLSGKKFLHMTRDDSEIQELIEQGQMQETDRYKDIDEASVITHHLPLDKEQAKTYPYKEEIVPPTMKKIAINSMPGDVLVIECSDGISGFVSPEEILELALKYRQLCGPEIMTLVRSRHDQPHGFEMKVGTEKVHIVKNSGDNRTIATMLI